MGNRINTKNLILGGGMDIFKFDYIKNVSGINQSINQWVLATCPQGSTL
jgi:hypothetical protein